MGALGSPSLGPLLVNGLSTRIEDLQSITLCSFEMKCLASALFRAKYPGEGVASVYYRMQLGQFRRTFEQFDV